MLIVIVATGATVRLTGSGLGCRALAGLQAGEPLPAKGYHSYVEFWNRIVAGGRDHRHARAWLARCSRRRAEPGCAGSPLATFLGTLAQAPLGAITVYYDLNPWLVLHALPALARRRSRRRAGCTRGLGRARRAVPARFERLALLVGAACAALVVTGMFATAAGPHSGSIDEVPSQRLGDSSRRCGSTSARRPCSGSRSRARSSGSCAAGARHLRVGLVVLAVLAAQMVVGEIQYRTELPWWLVLVHVTLAATLWAATVVFVASLWRPHRVGCRDGATTSFVSSAGRNCGGPVLVRSFRGWNDGGQGASLAGAFLARAWGAERFAEIDPESFFDFQSTRPHVSLVEGRSRRIDWPENSFHPARLRRGSPRRRAPARDRAEPPLAHVLRHSSPVSASDLGVELVVTLGSLLADVPHTRPAPVTASATDPGLSSSSASSASRYEGPTGIVGVLHDACRAAGIPSVVALGGRAPLRLDDTVAAGGESTLRSASELLDIPLDTSELESASEAYMQQVSEAVAADEETAAYVDELESRVDEIDDEAIFRPATRSRPS